MVTIPMRLIAYSTLSAFWTKHPSTKVPLERWATTIKAGTWQTPSEVLATFTKAKALNAECIRFEIAGGDYRLIVAFKFRSQIAFIKFIGTHAEYDRVDALTVSLF